MARTNRGIYQEAEYTSQIPRAEGRVRRIRRATSAAVITSAVAIGDAFSRGALSASYNEHVLAHLPFELQIPTDNVTPSRLAVAGLYAAVGVIGAVHANRAQSRVNHLEEMGQHEAAMDRLTAATQLAAGQRLSVDVMPEPGDVL